MEYAIVLYFDSETEDYFNKIINDIAGGTANHSITDAKMPPHITVSSFRTEKIEDIINALDKNYLSFTAATVIWPSLGTFVPQVLYAAPVLNKYLLDCCEKANQLVGPYVDEPDKFYLPYNWVPHTSLAMNLTPDELKIAFDIAIRQFTFRAGKSNRLCLAECNPSSCGPLEIVKYEEIKIWDLA